jgi:pre-mRNA cleavage complex 2 protein Pcf11
VRNTPCPICQEKFEQSWNEELQDFVFIDAVKVGGRIYHASCYADYRKDDGNTPARNSTPDSVLGKRKAEVNTGGPSPAKIRREGGE